MIKARRSTPNQANRPVSLHLSGFLAGLDTKNNHGDVYEITEIL
jgi:hypothetical protein